MFSQGTLVMGSSGVAWPHHGVPGPCAGQQAGADRQHCPFRAAGSSEGWPAAPAWQGGLGRAGTSTPAAVRAWARMDPPGRGTDTSELFALCTVVFILGDLAPPAENFVIHMGAGHSRGSPRPPGRRASAAAVWQEEGSTERGSGLVTVP